MMKRESIFLAGILHDIGKFWQSTDHVAGVESDFLEKYNSFWGDVVGANDYKDFLSATGRHHNSDVGDIFHLIVEKANQYALGMSGEAKADSAGENQATEPISTRTRRIFESIGFVNSTHAPTKHTSLTPFENSVFFGGEAYSSVQTGMWDAFERDFAKMTTMHGDGFSVGENLLFLLHKYARTVPAHPKHLPDVSLYDHLRSVAAFSVCLHDFLNANDRLKMPLEIADDEAPFLLVGGDLSGIQKYIYDIVSNDAARNLKGRSFYLQLLVENTIEEILGELGLPHSAVVYASGGSFFLIAPNTTETVSKLSELRANLNDVIFKAHQTNLSLQIAWTEVTQAQLFNQQINEVWRVLTGDIAKLKSQKYKSQIVHDFQSFFNPSEVGGDIPRDFVTGEELDLDEKQYKTEEESEGGETIVRYFKKSISAQTDLGRKLRQTDFWITSYQPIHEWKEQLFQVEGFAIYNYLLSKEQAEHRHVRNLNHVFIRAFDLKNYRFDKPSQLLEGRNNIYGFTFYGGNDYPSDEQGNPLTFDNMAAHKGGAEKLGLLRMDVDGLGAIFISGMDGQRRTFSRYSVLSRSLDFFFKGHLNQLWEKYFSSSCSIIYSGGDDLFIVGYWSEVIDFAERIQQDFKEWVCGNPSLSISGGVALTGGKFPISKGAILSADAEELAKKHEANDHKKNAITLFGVPLNWDEEFPIVKELKTTMVELVRADDLPRGTLQKLMTYSQTARYQQENGKNQSWRWHMAYDFARAAARHKSKPEVKDFFNSLKKAAFFDRWHDKSIPITKTRRTFLDLLEVAARWAELETKPN